MTTITKIERGTTYRIEAVLKDVDSVTTDPDQSGGAYLITITITNTADGTVEVNAVTMTRESTGTFYYDWSTSASDTLGEYTVLVQATLSGVVILNRDYVELISVA